MLTRPEVHFDPVMNNAMTDNTGERITLRDFNRNVLKINDTAFFTQEKYDWADIPAMVNTVTMTKLLMLSREGLDRLIGDLEEKGFTANGFSPLLAPGPDDVPAILGFMGSLDDDNQWCRDPRMLFARDGCAYRKLFLRQTGEDSPSCLAPCDLPADGSVTRTPFEIPLAAGHGSPMNIVLETAGLFKMWGKILKGGLYDFRSMEELLAERYPQLAQPVAVSAGDDDFLALCRDGTVWAWGLHIHPALGTHTPVKSYAPRQIPNLENITMISAGLSHRLALRSNGTVWSWGDSESVGELGQGPGYHSSKLPRRVRGIGDIVSISAGRNSGLALDSRGEVWRWGYLAEPGRPYTNLAEKVPGISEVIAVDAGDDHSLALKKDGTVWAWGSNAYMQLGDGTTVYRPQPVRVQGLTDVRSIAAGRHFSVALRNDGTVWVWGRGDHRELGDGTMPVRIKAPSKVPRLTPIVALDAGAFYVIALDEDGNIWEWGHTWIEPKKFPK
jgi:alpha-tubulin suppressor-like RCC1 family protein